MALIRRLCGDVLTRVPAGQAQDQGAKHAIVVRRVHMGLEEAALVIHIELVLLCHDAGMACEPLDVRQHPGLARVEGRQELVAFEGKCLPVGWVQDLHRHSGCGEGFITS